MAWAPDYVTVEELAAQLNIESDGDEVQLGLAISAASRAVDKATGRQFGVTASAEDRYYTAWYDEVREKWVVPIDDVMTTASMTVAFYSDADETYSTTTTDYRLAPVNAAVKGRPWTDVVFGSSASVTDLEWGVKVHATFGWTSVPDAVVQATLLQASRFFSRKNSPYGIAGSPQMGGELRLLAKVDPDVEVALADYKRPTWVFA